MEMLPPAAALSRADAVLAGKSRAWSCIPRETRKSLDAERVWAARSRLLDAVKELYEPVPESAA